MKVSRSGQPFGALSFEFFWTASILALQRSDDVSPSGPTGTTDARRSHVTRASAALAFQHCKLIEPFVT